MGQDQTGNTNPVYRIINTLSNIAGYLSALAIVIATLAITEGVLVRYIFRTPTIWQVELAVYMLMCATFLGSPWVLKEKGHINIQLITSRFSKRTNAVLNLSTSLIAFGFCVLVAWKGWIMWYEAYEGGWVSESLWSVPLVYPYLTIPVGMSLTALQFLVTIHECVQDLRDVNGKMLESVTEE